jgi:hypothetical protein
MKKAAKKEKEKGYGVPSLDCYGTCMENWIMNLGR